MRTKSLVLLEILLAVATLASGQVTLTADIPFAFNAGGKLLPAGQYEIIPSASEPVIRVRNVANRTEILDKIVTRTAAAVHTTSADAHLVFDKIGDKYTLSEIWIPELDGYVLSTTNEKHEHRIINIPR
jgi:hypothetical protein